MFLKFHRAPKTNLKIFVIVQFFVFRDYSVHKAKQLTKHILELIHLCSDYRHFGKTGAVDSNVSQGIGEVFDELTSVVFEMVEVGLLVLEFVGSE
jgi:hypothetical protein